MLAFGVLAVAALASQPSALLSRRCNAPCGVLTLRGGEDNHPLTHQKIVEMQALAARSLEAALCTRREDGRRKDRDDAWMKAWMQSCAAVLAEDRVDAGAAAGLGALPCMSMNLITQVLLAQLTVHRGRVRDGREGRCAECTSKGISKHAGKLQRLQVAPEN